MDLIDALEASIKNPMRTAPDCVVVMPELLRMVINEIKRLRKENQDLEDSLFNLGCEMKERT